MGITSTFWGVPAGNKNSDVRVLTTFNFSDYKSMGTFSDAPGQTLNGS